MVLQGKEGSVNSDSVNIFSCCNIALKTVSLIKKESWVISIDFTKVFDSINRTEMIKILEEYKIHPWLTNVISEIYSHDSTQISLNNKTMTNIDISTGIQQGCNLSTLLFILVTYKIIEIIHRWLHRR